MSIINAKLIVIICIAWVLILHHNSSAQQIKDKSEVDLNFPSPVVRMDSLGSRIDKQSGFILSYNASVIDPGRVLVVPKLHIKLTDFLTYLEKRYHLHSEILGNHIIIRNERPQKTRILPSKMKERGKTLDIGYSPRNSPVSPETGNHVISSITQINSIPKATYQDTKIKTESRASLVQASSKWRLKIMRAARQKQKYDSYPRVPAQRKKDNGLKTRFTTSIGLVSDETFYVQPTLKAGMPGLFGLLSWRTNFNTSGIVYGIGTQVHFSEDWAITLTAKTGPLLKKFEWMDTDSTIGKIRIKGNMNQVGVLATKRIGRLTVQFGPTVNFIKSSYSFSGENQPTRNQMDSTYHLIKPLYTIENAYSNVDKRNQKIWIGLQLGLFYQLR